MLQELNDLFWDERWWFPNLVRGVHYGWKDVENMPGSETYYPQITDLHWGFALGILLVIFRVFYERYIVTPIGYKLGIRNPRLPYVTPNPLLEAAYKQKSQKPDYESLSKQTDWTVRQVEVWFRKRRKRDATPTIKKFCESSWQLLFYSTSFIYGLYVLWDTPWFTRSFECWTDWPKQHVSNDIYWYYILELAFYWSLIFTLATDHRRSDFYQMLLHHFATVILLYFSWIANFVRVGSLVLILHDAADPWLSCAKLGIYLKWETYTSVVFVTFVVVWTVSRLFLLPYTVLYTTTYEVLDLIDAPFFANYFFNFFLYLLMILTLIWTYHIILLVIHQVTQGEVKDNRSDSEDEKSDEVPNYANGPSKNGERKNGAHNKTNATSKSVSDTTANGATT